MVQSIDSARRKPPGPPSPQTGRVPPHNLDAERSLLGAMLLSRDAIAAAMETCSAEDFYKPAHAHIFEAINVLYNQGEPADPVTVADELSRAGLLESSGGLAALVALQADTPATTNAARYARIVEEHALLRRLIAVAGEIAEMGYGVPDDVAAAMDQAESLVFNVAERRVTDSLKGLPELLTASMDRLEQLFDRNETITGVPTGYVDLDERLFGLQPNALVIVGARPAVGKCLSADTRVLDGRTGEMATVEDLFRRQQQDPRPFQVVSLRADRQLEPRYVSAFVDDGVKPVYRVTTRLGRTVRTTGPHPFLTPGGWRPLADIAVGTRIGVPRVVRTEAGDRMAPAELKILAYLLGDGTWGRAWPQVTTASRAVVADLTAAAASLGVRVVPGPAAKRRSGGGAGLDYRLTAERGGPNPVIDLLRKHGMWGCGAADKRVPPAVFKLELQQVALFLNRLFSTDGSAWCDYSGDGYGRIGYCSISHQLVRDVQHLLLRFGVNGRIRFRSAPYKGTRRPAWELELTSRADITRFCASIGIFSKEAAVDRVLDMVLAKKEMGWTSDTLPMETWDAILAARGRRSWASVNGAAAAGPESSWPMGRRSSRHETVAVLADVLDDDELKDQACSDIYWDEIVGIVPDGEAQVYDLTVPETHNFVADDIVVHNTAFALGIAAHAAVEARVPTLVFSLEMGAEEITNRLLVSEARVDANRMRNGQLKEPDWPKISTAVARLGDAPLYVDDNPNTTIMEIRAKARRLKARQGGLGLIVVDYLQLMSGGSTAENRQLEVSSISRGLKILARELEVPVVALSQLSRQLEQRSDKRPTLADLRESGCMPASTRLLRADTGEEVTLGELVLSQEQPLVWTLDDITLKMVPRKLVRAFPSGVKPVFRLRLRSGYEVEATANHRFRTVGGWRRLDEISVGDHLATPRAIKAPVAAGDLWTDDELVLLAHLLGDGSIGPGGVKYATADPSNKAAVEETAKRLFGIEVAGSKQRNTWLLWLPSPVRLTHRVRHPVRNWLEPHGLWGSRSHDKFIPPSVFGAPDRKVALFLRHLWATDGSITLSRNGRGPVVRIYYATTSRRLAEGVRMALLRLGIRSRVSPSKKAGYRLCWHVTVTGTPDLRKFLTTVGCHGSRGDRIEAALAALATMRPNPNVDLIPFAVREEVAAALKRSALSHRSLAAALGEHYSGSYLLGSADRPRRFSRVRLARIAEVAGDERLASLANSEIFWDEVVEISPVGLQPTFDATVEGTHNFVANGIIAHNSLEQDADVVMFLYRDEIYNPDSADRGIAEVIVAKHRNGPTGKVQLSFLEQYTKFVNMARV